MVADLAELLSLCAQLQAEKRSGDGVAWAATVACLGTGDGRLEDARAALGERGESDLLLALAEAVAGERRTARALALHAARVD